jgi:hypothetical protein
MTLLTSLANKVRTLSYSVYVGGQPTKIVSASWDLGYDVISSSAVVVVDEMPSTLAFRQELEIWAGWDGFTAPAFKGEIEQDQRSWFPFDGNIRASGYLRRAQSKYPDALSFSNQNDDEIIEALMPLAGITNFSIDGEGVTDLGTVQPVVLAAGTPIINLVNEIDQIFSYKTFDASDGQVYRRRHAGLPSATAAFTFTEGVNAYRITRRLGSVYDISNQVNVYGLPQSGITWPTTRQGVNPLVPDPPGFIAFDLRSSLIETQIVASVLAARLMGEVNGIPDEVEIETWGNPLIQPSMTIEVTSAKNNMSAVHYWVKHIHHEITSNGYFMRIIGERREGDLGEETGKPPVAQFTYRISKETYEVGGVPTTMYTVTADGSSSWDPDSAPSTLTFSWANNKNADVGTDVVYTTTFTEAQMRAATKPTITLTVNDADASSAAGSVTKTITIDADPINERTLYVAVSGRAEATDDGGETWQTWTPGAGTVISTAPIAASTYGLFGLSNGKLMYTADVLLTAPTEAEDFGSQIDCIWVNEIDPDRVTVGLTNGQVHVTNNMTAIASSTWTQLADFASAVLWIEESANQQGQYRLAMGNQILISYDSLATTGELVNFGADTARNGATSFFANYYAASSADEIKREDGTVITGDATSDIRAIAHHIRDDVLFAVNTAGQSYRKAAGATALTAKVAITTPGTVNHMINDGDNQRIFYVAANQGLYKTFDEFISVVRMRDYTGGGFDGLKVGRASLSLVNPALTGKRVVVAGISGSAPKFAYTENIFAVSPVWVGNNTGLSGSTEISFIRLDPFDPSNKAIAVIGDSIWRNTNYRGGGSWSNIYTPAAGAVIRDVSFTIASQGRLYVYHDNATGGTFASHTHDYTNGASPTFTNTTISGAQPIGGNMRVGQWNPDLVFIPNPNASTPDSLWRSTDGGHAFSQILLPGSTGALVSLPYEGNANEQEIFYHQQPASTVWRSTDQGTTFSSYSTVIATNISTPKGMFKFSASDSQLAFGHEEGTAFYKSTNKLSTVSTSVYGGTINDSALFQDDTFYVCADPGTASLRVATSPDATTWTGRVGNLITDIFTGAGPSVKSLTVDPSS